MQFFARFVSGCRGFFEDILWLKNFFWSFESFLSFFLMLLDKQKSFQKIRKSFAKFSRKLGKFPLKASKIYGKSSLNKKVYTTRISFHF
jgi:hypothetical protein